MEAPENPTIEKNATVVVPPKSDKPFIVTPGMQSWIEYKAMNGLIFDWDGAETSRNPQTGKEVNGGIPMKKMTTQEFALALGVHRDTLYDWTKKIPDFWERVAEARTKLSGRDRLAKVHETLYLKAVAGHPTLLPIWLSNFDPNFKMPNQKVEVDVSDNMADLMKQLRADRDGERKQVDNQVVEGEVVESQN